MHFQISALPMTLFRPLFALGEDELRLMDICRVIADGRPAYPCRVSLQDAIEGEELLLLSFVHQAADTPYRATGPIYVRQAAAQATPSIDEIPQLLRSRLLSMRAYDGSNMMVGAEVVAGTELEQGLARIFTSPRTSYLHLHYAKPGCYSCRADRV